MIDSGREMYYCRTKEVTLKCLQQGAWDHSNRSKTCVCVRTQPSLCVAYIPPSFCLSRARSSRSTCLPSHSMLESHHHQPLETSRSVALHVRAELSQGILFRRHSPRPRNANLTRALRGQVVPAQQAAKDTGQTCQHLRVCT